MLNLHPKQIAFEWPKPQATDTEDNDDDREITREIITINESTKIEAKFALLENYTESEDCVVNKLKIVLKVESSQFPEVGSEVAKVNLELKVKVEVYDTRRLETKHKSKKSWKFLENKRQIKVLPILLPDSVEDKDTQNLEIRVDLRVLCFKLTIDDVNNI